MTHDKSVIATITTSSLEQVGIEQNQYKCNTPLSVITIIHITVILLLYSIAFAGPPTLQNIMICFSTRSRLKISTSIDCYAWILSWDFRKSRRKVIFDISL